MSEARRPSAGTQNQEHSSGEVADKDPAEVSLSAVEEALKLDFGTDTSRASAGEVHAQALAEALAGVSSASDGLNSDDAYVLMKEAAREILAKAQELLSSLDRYDVPADGGDIDKIVIMLARTIKLDAGIVLLEAKARLEGGAPPALPDAADDLTSDDEMTNEVDAKIAAAEARTDVKFVEMKGQLALVLEAVKESRNDMGEVQSELRSARSTYVVTAIASVIAIGGLVIGLLAYGGDQFGRGADVAQVVDAQIDRKLDSLYELVNKALIEQRATPPVRQ